MTWNMGLGTAGSHQKITQFLETQISVARQWSSNKQKSAPKQTASLIDRRSANAHKARQ